jgi:general nucleoside transport system ATP-binding protein
VAVAPDAPVVLEVRGITKTFPGVIANQDVDLSLRHGEIHCLLGENGAGKSTLMNVLYGLYQPDGGQILVRGEPVRFDSSGDAIAHGIGMVHQHFQLIPTFTVSENVALGNETSRRGRLDLDHTRDRIRDISTRYGLHVDPDAVVGELSVGVQQRIELIKALYRDADVLILDEPTAVLTPGEVDEFFRVVRGLVDKGKSIIFITHKLREVLAVADRITVLRAGRAVGTADPATATEQDLANLMVGRDVVFTVDKAAATPGDPVLRIEGLTVTDERDVTTVSGLDLTVRAGEIFGIAGVEGNGQRELVQAITGMRTPSAGTITVLGTDTTHATPRAVADLGVGHVPEDRNRHGVVGAFSIVDNVVLNRYHKAPFSQRALRREAPMRDLATTVVEQFDVRTPSIDATVQTLSGGNQQKVIVGREMTRDVRLLVVAQPTRGLDVGSIEFIHRRIVEMRDNGVAVLLVSAELDEILSLSDRVGVLYRGRLVGELDRDDATREGVGLLMASGAPTEAVS